MIARTRLFAAAATMAILVAAPLPAAEPAFEVATIKPNGGRPGPSRYPVLRNGRFTAENASLKTLLAVAYGLIPSRIGGPDWLGSEKFDIVATSPEGVPDSEIKPMLERLLHERFLVEAHRERKEIPAFNMVVASGGMKLKLFDPDHPPVTPPNTGGLLFMGVGTTSQIADSLAFLVDRPVIDHVAVDGRFVYQLRYSPISQSAGSQPSAADGPPEVLTAVQEQLGLRLESKKQPLDILVVDRASRQPTPN